MNTTTHAQTRTRKRGISCLFVHKRGPFLKHCEKNRRFRGRKVESGRERETERNRYGYRLFSIPSSPVDVLLHNKPDTAAASSSAAWARRVVRAAAAAGRSVVLIAAAAAAVERPTGVWLQHP